MKTNMLNAAALVKKLMMALGLIAITLTTAKASDPDSSTNDENASVSCLKMEAGQVYFNVKFGNTDGGRFDLIVNDASGDNLYRATFNGKNFDKVFRAPVDGGKLVIIVRDSKNKIKQTFELTTEAKMVQQIYVKRM